MRYSVVIDYMSPAGEPLHTGVLSFEARTPADAATAAFESMRLDTHAGWHLNAAHVFAAPPERFTPRRLPRYTVEPAR